MNQLASAIAKYEGKKHQASIGDIREIIKIILEFDFQSHGKLALYMTDYRISRLTKELGIYKKKKKKKDSRQLEMDLGDAK